MWQEAWTWAEYSSSEATERDRSRSAIVSGAASHNQHRWQFNRTRPSGTALVKNPS